MLRHGPLKYLIASASLVLFLVMGYGIPRHQTSSLLIIFLLLFTGYILVIRKSNELDEDNVNFWILTSILFRASLLFSIPALSDDFYRFIWDGRVLAAGENPFQRVPSFYMDPANGLPGLDVDLYERLNSKERFSSYPPVCQFIYWISVKLSPDSMHGSVLVMKNFLLLFEIGTLWLIKRLAVRLNMPTAITLIYALNPLIILEIGGNVHFEGVMIFFLLLAIYLVLRGNIPLSSGAYALSVCTKLIPLMFLPLFYHPLGSTRVIKYWLMIGLGIILLYYPVLDPAMSDGYSTSLGYYFQRFEFNASIYYLVRAVGYLFTGFNIIAYAGPALAVIAAALILKISFRPRYFSYSSSVDTEFFKGITLCLFVYLLLSPIVHPWYTITLLAVSIFAGYRFPIAWTGLVFLSYAGYTQEGYQENFFLVAGQYIAVIVVFFFETEWRTRISHS